LKNWCRRSSHTRRCHQRHHSLSYYHLNAAA
jgi:hypothetical protein